MSKVQTVDGFERLFTPAETANALGVSLSWLAKARLRGDGPCFIKLGRSVRYRNSSIQDYLKARTRTSTSSNSLVPESRQMHGRSRKEEE